MISMISNILVLVGILILLGSLMTVKKIIRRLPLGGSRTSWYAMSGLIILFVVGYLGYLLAFRGQLASTLDLIVPGIFFFGACFVWLSSILALQTAMDVMRITVLEHESFTDPLTGLYNRRFMEQHLAEEVSKARRYEFDLALFLLDLDNFKSINDQYGHQAGDQLLIEIGSLVTKQLRDSDVLSRYGGEEFLVIAPNTGPAAASLLAERLRGHIQSHRFLKGFKDTQDIEIRVTVSIGLANFGGTLTSEEALIHAADKRLYRAKEQGRNRVVDGETEKA